MPQGFSAMVYQRSQAQSMSEVCQNWRDAAAKAVGQAKLYSGVESDVAVGALVCTYDLPKTWKDKANIDEFEIEAKVDNPAKLPSTACMPLNYNTMLEMMCETGFQVAGGPVWMFKSKGRLSSLCSMAKAGIASLRSSPEGLITGKIKTSEFRPFMHTCTYAYHSSYLAGSIERKLVINGTLSLPILKAVNEQIEKSVTEGDENRR